jgi:putative ABC transport system permease protein
MALGASSAAVVRLPMTQSGRLVAVGGSVGLIVSLAVLSILKALVRLDNVSLLDAGAFATSVALIGAAAGIATYYPARRASHIDPAETLRAEA